MADLTITGSAVIPTKDAQGQTSPLYPAQGIAGETLTQGMPIYRNTNDNKLYRCDATGAGVEQSRALGVTISAASPGQFVHYWGIEDEQEISFGAILTVGQLYVVSTNVGMIAPITDYATGMYLTTLFYATTTSLAKFLRRYTNVQKA